MDATSLGLPDSMNKFGALIPFAYTASTTRHSSLGIHNAVDGCAAALLDDSNCFARSIGSIGTVRIGCE